MIPIQNLKKKKYTYLQPVYLDFLTDKALLSCENVFKAEECLQLINFGEEQGFTLASLFTDRKKKTHYATDIRNSLRCLVDDSQFAKVLEARIRHLIPNVYNGLSYLEINSRFRFLKYQEAGHFIRHTDDHYMVDQQKSLITVLIYLNVGYQGGQTRFFRDSDDKIGYQLEPQVGMVCLMDQTIEHDVPKITEGVKYVIRTELMYQ